MVLLWVGARILCFGLDEQAHVGDDALCDVVAGLLAAAKGQVSSVRCQEATLDRTNSTPILDTRYSTASMAGRGEDAVFCSERGVEHGDVLCAEAWRRGFDEHLTWGTSVERARGLCALYLQDVFACGSRGVVSASGTLACQQRCRSGDAIGWHFNSRGLPRTKTIMARYGLVVVFRNAGAGDRARASRSAIYGRSVHVHSVDRTFHNAD